MKLVADIGGTHARFAQLGADGEPVQIQNLKTADFQNLTSAVEAYLGIAQLSQSSAANAWTANDVSAVISIAAPLSTDRVKMTNAPWDFSIAQTKLDLGFNSLQLLNDFEALALAVPTLRIDELAAVGHTLTQDKQHTKAILGPGTGLGMAGVMPVWGPGQATWHALPCEGGHASLAPTTAREAVLLQAAWDIVPQAAGGSHLCWEDFLSGTGLPLLHRAVCAVDDLPYLALLPSQIGEAALLHADAACLATLQTFCAMLGSAAGDLALMTGARGGVYIKGGVLDRMLELAPDFLAQSEFRLRFEAKGGYANYMQAIPTWFIKTPQIALRGCATLL